MTATAAESNPPAPAGIPVSEWYGTFSVYTFPSVFIHLAEAERQALGQGLQEGPAVGTVIERLNHAIGILPGACFVHADVCAPTDSPRFQAAAGALRNGRTAWRFLTESVKVRTAVAAGLTTRLAVHPYRRMDPVREFRMFLKDRELRAMSQYRLDRYHEKLHKRRETIWRRGKALAAALAPALPWPDVVADVYLTSTDELILLDFNRWGAPTAPLLLRAWDIDWSQELGLKLIPSPLELHGDVSVSF